jgi:hypothetical protein
VQQEALPLAQETDVALRQQPDRLLGFRAYEAGVLEGQVEHRGQDETERSGGGDGPTEQRGELSGGQVDLLAAGPELFGRVGRRDVLHLVEAEIREEGRPRFGEPRQHPRLHDRRAHADADLAGDPAHLQV